MAADNEKLQQLRRLVDETLADAKAAEIGDWEKVDEQEDRYNDEQELFQSGLIKIPPNPWVRPQNVRTTQGTKSYEYLNDRVIDSFGDTLLMKAIRFGDLEYVRKLVAA